MRRHPIYAFQWLSRINYLRPALHIPCSHHEKWDGSGYPHGLKGDAIPLEARIFAVVDVWDALISDRPYKPAWPPKKAAEFIRSQKNIHFDPKIVDIFLDHFIYLFENNHDKTKFSVRQEADHPYCG